MRMLKKALSRLSQNFYLLIEIVMILDKSFPFSKPGLFPYFLPDQFAVPNTLLLNSNLKLRCRRAYFFKFLKEV